jgi:hypothetical protein
MVKRALRLGFASHILESMAKERAGEGGRGRRALPWRARTRARVTARGGQELYDARNGVRASVVLRWWRRVVFLRALRSGGFSDGCGRADSVVGDMESVAEDAFCSGPSFSLCLPKLAVMTLWFFVISSGSSSSLARRGIGLEL